MGRHILERTLRRHRRLHYGDIKLVPVDFGLESYRPDAWHLPGGTQATTSELVSLANKRGITVRLSESLRDGQILSRLN